MFSRYEKDDEILIRDIRNREASAFNYFRKKCFKRIEVQLIKLNLGALEAEDIFNENIARIIKVVDDPALKMEARLTSLFVQMCDNHLKEELRNRKTEYQNIEDNHTPYYEEDFDARMDRIFFENILHKSFKKLGKDCRKILKKFLEDYSLKEIAESMGLSPAYMKKKKHLCYKSLLEYVYATKEYQQMKMEP